VRILVLAAYPPSSIGAHGGSLVAAELIGRLAEVHRIGLVCLRGPGQPDVDAAIHASCEFVLEVDRPELSHHAARRRRFSGLVRGRPSWVAEWADADVGRQVRAVASRWRPHIVHVHYQVMGQFIDGLEGTPRVLVVYEPATPRARAALAAANGIRRALRAADFFAWRRFERRLIASADAVTAFTEADRAALEALGQSTSILVIPFGTTLPARPCDPVGSDQGVVLFFGNFEHQPNVDAARTLVRLWSQVRRRRPTAQLELVGPHPPPDLETRKGEGILVTGAVPDVAPYLERASVVTAPLREGGGMRVKVLETLAAGKALVASPIALEGLAAPTDVLMVANSDDELIDAISRLLAKPELRRELGGRARRFAEEHLAWDRSIAAYEELHRTLVSDASPPAEAKHDDVAHEAAQTEAASSAAAVPANGKDARKSE
jgi:glycosyltransferase involved in cell wall biosynthesis